MFYADVILPLPLQGLFTYSLPSNMKDKLSEGSRVIVQFGKKKFYTAIIFSIYEADETQLSVKEVVASLEDYPIVTPLQLKFWEWIANYYMCSLGDVYRAALPSALKLESETHVLLNTDFEASEPLTLAEQKVFYLLSDKKSLKISDIERQSGLSNIIPVIKSLTEKQAVFASEDIRNTYSVKTSQAVRFPHAYSEQEQLQLLDDLSRAKKQQHLLSTFLHLHVQQKTVLKKDLLEESNTTSAVLSELVRKGILEIYNYQIGRFDYGDTDMDAAYSLNPYQQQAFEEIIESFTKHSVTLLHGVTSSGKTEIYIQLIKDAINKGKKALYLLPEIALTTQITERLKAVFGNKLAVYHSKFSDNERAEIWHKLLTDTECQVILGTRSSVFLPFTDLELIIVDEEHDGSYKQQDPAPRYNARNAAAVLGNMCNAKVLLGTATPSLETYYNALGGRYGMVQLSQRHDDIALPEMIVVNTKELRRKKQMKSILSPPLMQAIDNGLNKKEQIILFQNRRGFASMLECKTCAWTPQCNHCDVSLTYHKGQRILMCHYCGATYAVPEICPDCKTPTLDFLGYGTERIEEEVASLFPEARLARMDLDTTRGKRSYEHIISEFEDNNTDILIGTQMVSKGLDFDNVSIVGILNADNLLNYPDFRAHERAYQLLTQVSGRAGRKNKQGVVFLQTSHPAHPVINYVRQNDYKSFYDLQIEERRVFRYPPFFRLISITVRHRDELAVEQCAQLFSQELRKSFQNRVLGPSKPPVSRIQSLYIRRILLKVENQASIQKVRDVIKDHQLFVLNNPMFKTILLHYDVDPM